MQDAMNSGEGAQPLALLAPIEALLRGFELEASAAVPAAGTAPRATAPADTTQGTQLREGFRIGALNLMIRYEDGNELTDLPQLYRLPNSPRWFVGVTNLHGTLVSVFDPAALFGVPHDAAAKPMLLVLGHGDDKAGVLIDGLPQRLRLTPDDRLDQAAVPDDLAACVSEVYRIDGVDWMDFRYATLFERLAAELAQ